jgi:hypothetical protein
VEHNSTNKHAGTYRYRRPHQGFLSAICEDSDEEKQERYEEAVIKRILKHIGEWDLRYKLWYKQKDQFDVGRLAFCDFQEYTGFPMWLGTRRMYMAKHLSLVNLLRDSNQPFFAAFFEVSRAAPNRMAGCPVGLVFPVPGIKYMVLHNWPSGPAEHGDTRIAIPLTNGSVLTLEKLDDLLEKVGDPDTWRTLQS